MEPHDQFTRNKAPRRVSIYRGTSFLDGPSFLMIDALQKHWPEYFMEAAELAIFMISAGIFGALLEYPGSPLRQAISDPLLRRAIMGLLMGITAVAIIFSPWGKRSGAHFNPAVTLAFFRLGKVKPWDAAFYVISQFLGGIGGIWLVALAIRKYLDDPAVKFVATVPGPTGIWVAFGAEFILAFVLMMTVLIASNRLNLAKWTGVFAGVLLVLFITFEAPYSGMSINPARTFGSAFVGSIWTALWIYFTAPVLAMLLAAEIYRSSDRTVHCAKLHHVNHKRCIFKNCRFAELLATAEPPAPRAPGRNGARTRRQTLSSFAAGFALIVALSVAHAAAAEPQSDTNVTAVAAIGMTVQNMERSVHFYSDLSFKKVSDTEVFGEEDEKLEGVFGARLHIVRMQLGDQSLDLTEYVTPKGKPIPQDSRSNDLWFQHIAIVVSDMEKAYQYLREHGVESVSTEAEKLPDWNKAAAGIKAFYFRDPDAHNLEVIYFPPGKGDPRWQQSNGKLFLGIDHSAIAVSKTEASLKFYRDLLGLKIAGTSDNYGTEQEHLNLVFGARLHITSLRAPAGPGIEFLEYLTPRDGRSRPLDAKPNDLMHWQTTLVTPDLEALARKLEAQHATFVSPKIVEMPDEKSGFRKGLLVRDPDGHAMLLIQK